MDIRPGDFGDQRVLDMLRYHFAKCHEVTPPGSAHVFDVSRLQSPDVDFFAAWDGDELAGVGAIKFLTPSHGEIKSMHTSEKLRRRGVGSAILRHIIAVAMQKGVDRLSLETGSFGYFAPAVTLYRAHGFADCPPFGDYRPDPNSLFMMLDLHRTTTADPAMSHRRRP